MNLMLELSDKICNEAVGDQSLFLQPGYSWAGRSGKYLDKMRYLDDER